MVGQDDWDIIESWLQISGMTEAELGEAAAQSSNAIAELRDGTARPDTLLKILSFIRKQMAR